MNAVKTVTEKAPDGSTCDRCGLGTMAAVRVTLASLLTLDFCNHHAEAYKDKLIEAMFESKAARHAAAYGGTLSGSKES